MSLNQTLKGQAEEHLCALGPGLVHQSSMKLIVSVPPSVWNIEPTPEENFIETLPKKIVD